MWKAEEQAEWESVEPGWRRMCGLDCQAGTRFSAVKGKAIHAQIAMTLCFDS